MMATLNYMHQYYLEHKDEIKARVEKRKAAGLAVLEAYRNDTPCACGENDPACLEFHIDGSRSEQTDIRKIAKMGRRIETTTKMIKRYRVICANCHMKLHHGDRSTSRGRRR